MFALLEVKTWSIFCFGFFQDLVLPAESRTEDKHSKKQKQQQKTQFSKLKIGPTLLRNILGLIFNLDLDQFLIWKCVICCGFVLAEIIIL